MEQKLKQVKNMVGTFNRYQIKPKRTINIKATYVGNFMQIGITVQAQLTHKQTNLRFIFLYLKKDVSSFVCVLRNRKQMNQFV